MSDRTPFRYRPESVHDERRLIAAGWKLIEHPKPGDKVVGFAFFDDSSHPVYVKANTPCHHRVSRWFNKQTREWSTHFHIYCSIPTERTSKS